MLSDLRLSLRLLAKSPGYSALIVLMLAVGIGANVAIFSFFRGILLRPLPFVDPDRVVVAKKIPHDVGDVMGEGVGLRAADYRDLVGQLKSIEDLATYTADVATLTGRETPQLIYGSIVTDNFFSMLGSTAMVGRTFGPTDRAHAPGRMIVLSENFWKNNLGGDSSILGQSLTMNGVSFTVVGVMPADFNFPKWSQYWVTPATDVPEDHLGDTQDVPGSRGNAVRTVVGRLRPGVTIEQAEQEIGAVVRDLPTRNGIKRSAYLVNLRDQTVGEVRPLLAILLGCVGMVLFIACLNVANLMLSRAIGRQREIAIRLSVGSSRWQIARQLLVESLVLSLISGALGIALSAWGLGLLTRVAPEATPRLSVIRLDGGVLLFALAVTVLTGLISGLAPILGTASTDLMTALKREGRGTTGGGLAARMRGVLVTCEVGLSLTLLIAAGLLIRSFWELQAASWGFTPTHVVSARVGFTSEKYSTDAASIAFTRALTERLKQTPGFERVGLSFDRIGETWIHLAYIPDGQPFTKEEESPKTNYRIVDAGYFSTLGIALQQGRNFNENDRLDTPAVAIIDASIARRFFPDGNAVGKRIRFPSSRRPWVEIVGVVNNVKSNGPEGGQLPDIYRPWEQLPDTSAYIYVNTALDPATALNTLSRVVHGIDPSLPINDAASMEQVVARPAAARQFPLGILGAFAAFALILAAVGIYAVTSYGVAQRTREFGVRMALGAQPSAVIRLVLRQGFRPVAIGLCAGVLGGVATAFAMRNLLYGIAPLDGKTFLVTPGVLAAIGLVACLFPARRATKVDPMVALRAE